VSGELCVKLGSPALPSLKYVGLVVFKISLTDNLTSVGSEGVIILKFGKL
jgi:hypothetical protein